MIMDCIGLSKTGPINSPNTNPNVPQNNPMNSLSHVIENYYETAQWSLNSETNEIYLSWRPNKFIRNHPQLMDALRATRDVLNWLVCSDFFGFFWIFF